MHSPESTETGRETTIDVEVANRVRNTAIVAPERNWTRAFFVGKSPAGGHRRPLVPAPSELREVVDRGVTFRVVWDGSIR